MSFLTYLIPNLFIVLSTLLGVFVGAVILYSAKYFPRDNQFKVALIGIATIILSVVYFFVGSIIKNITIKIFDGSQNMLIFGIIIFVVVFAIILFYPNKKKSKKNRKSR